MNPNIVLTKMTEKQRQAWVLRHAFGWPLQRIALRIGGTRMSVGNLLRRGGARAGLQPSTQRNCLRRRRVYAMSLSSTFNV